MTATDLPTAAIDPVRLEQLLGTAVVDAGATMAAGLVVLGSRLGLYAALTEGPLTAGELAHAPAPSNATSANGPARRPPADI